MRVLVDIKSIEDGFSVNVGEQTLVGEKHYKKIFKCYDEPVDVYKTDTVSIQEDTMDAHVEIVNFIEDLVLSLDEEHCQPKRGDDGYFCLRLRDGDVPYIQNIEVCVKCEGFHSTPSHTVLSLVSVIGMIAPMLSVEWRD